MSEEKKDVLQKKQKSSARILMIAAVIVILVLGGYYGLESVYRKFNSIHAQALQSSLEQKYLQAKYEQLYKTVSNLQLDIQKSNLLQGEKWQPIIVEHLIEMADLTLQTSGNIKLAISYLKTARQYTGDRELSVINHALNKDIAKLQAMMVEDPNKLIIKIEKLNQTIGSLSLTPKKVVVLKNSLVVAEDSQEKKSFAKLWQRFLTNATQALKEMLIIRSHATEPLLPLAQEQVLRLNLRIRFLQVELAVMQQQDELYHLYLKDIKSLINKYFIANNDDKEKILSIIQELLNVNLESKIFTLSSWAAVKSFIKAKDVSKGSKPSAKLEGAKYT